MSENRRYQYWSVQHPQPGVLLPRSSLPNQSYISLDFSSGSLNASVDFKAVVATETMDPGTIIGVTSAVISFIDFIGKAVSTARKLSHSGSIDEYERLSDLTLALEPGIAKLQTLEESQLSDQEKSALQTALRCKQIGDAIQHLAGKMRLPEPTASATKLPASSVERLQSKVIRTYKAGKIGLLALWKSQEAEELRQQFDSCTIQLHTHLVMMARSDIVAKIDILLSNQLPKLSHDMDVGHAKLAQILQNHSSFSAVLSSFDERLNDISKVVLPELQRVRETLELSDMTLQAINNRRILNTVRFNEITTRFQQVSRAEKDTFGWIVEGTEIPAHYGLKISFRDWLASGDGVFHFSGKPGSGKSTLMKLLSQHLQTASQLRIWEKDKKLILATSFLWRAGVEKQRSMEGIVRSLLYAILDKHRDLIPRAFPKYWSPHSWFMQSPTEETDIQIENEVIQSVFERIIGDQSSQYKYCFFIDALDEFEDAEIRKRELASTICRWVSANPENVKVCVSSREELVFLELFPADQRIRLHLVTANDMRKAIETPLNKHDNFTRFALEARNEFVDAFVRAAEGVFIWTKLVLDELMSKLDDRQPLEDLEDVLAVAPTDMHKFYDRIIGLIRTSDVAESEAIFDLLITAREEWADPACLMVLDFSFIRDFVSPKSRRIPVTRSVAGEDRGAQARQIRIRRQAFQDRLHSLFHGMVKITQTLSPVRLGTDKLHMSLSFSHRSAYDFCQKRQRNRDGPRIDAKAVVLHCLRARVGCGWTFAGWETSVCQIISALITILPWIYDTADLKIRTSYFQVLAEMDNILIREQLAQGPTEHLQFPVGITNFHLQHPLPTKFARLIVSVFSVACWMGLHDYTDWVIQWPGSWVTKGTARISLLESLCWIEQRFQRTGALVPLIERLLQDGPYAGILDEHQSPWGTCLALFIATRDIFDERGVSWQLITAFLRSGANADVRFWLDETDRSIFRPTDISITIGGLSYSLMYRSTLLPIYFGPRASVPGGASLQDVYMRLGPKDQMATLDMINKNLGLVQSNSDGNPTIDW